MRLTELRLSVADFVRRVQHVGVAGLAAFQASQSLSHARTFRYKADMGEEPDNLVTLYLRRSDEHMGRTETRIAKFTDRAGLLKQGYATMSWRRNTTELSAERVGHRRQLIPEPSA